MTAAIAADFTATHTDNGILITGRSGRHYLARTIGGLVEVYRANRRGEARNRRVPCPKSAIIRPIAWAITRRSRRGQ